MIYTQYPFSLNLFNRVADQFNRDCEVGHVVTALFTKHPQEVYQLAIIGLLHHRDSCFSVKFPLDSLVKNILQTMNVYHLINF